MKKYIPFLTLFLAFFANSQDIVKVQKEIDQTLWRPFKQAFEELNAKKLNALYAEEVLRVTPKGIDTKNSFKEVNSERLNGHKDRSTVLELDFWFDSRHTNEDTSYEVGFYRMTLTNDEGIDDIYGQFHIVLKKRNGIWKITQDWDTTVLNGKALSKEDFEKQPPIRFD